MKLTKAEEQLMQILWDRKKAFMKDLIDAYDEPKPAATTIATLLKRMSDKKFISYTIFGNSRQYFPLVKKFDYFSIQLKEMVSGFFNGSTSQFASFFTKETNLSSAELEELKKIIDSEIKRKKDDGLHH